MIWLASYPRSGNTLLRTILKQCFDLPSASVYPSDLGGVKELEAATGHIEHRAGGQLVFPAGALPLVKTHEAPSDEKPAIYVIRDPRAVTVSYWHFAGRHQGLSLKDVIDGRHRWGTWGGHVDAWNPRTRPNCLLLQYEMIVADLQGTLASVGAFIDREAVRAQMPSRRELASTGSIWVRQESEWRDSMTPELEAHCRLINAVNMEKYGY